MHACHVSEVFQESIVSVSSFYYLNLVVSDQSKILFINLLDVS